jgi:hypothetical protein
MLSGLKRSNTISTDYSGYSPIDTKLSFTITGRFTDIGNTATYNCISYNTDDVQLVRNLTDYFGIEFDINTSDELYESYDSMVPQTYTEQVFMLNPNYDEEITDDSNPNHYRYQVQRNNDGLIDYLEGIDNTGVIVSIPKYVVNHELGDPIIDYTEITDTERANGPLESREYYILTDELNKVYTKVEKLTEFDKNTVYYRGKVRVLHEKGDPKIFNKKTGELISDAVDLSNVLAEYHPLPVTYTGITKNVPWINRLYFSNADMYETIRDLYNEIIDNVSSIKNVMFDGGLIYMGLKQTSGKSSKYQAYKLSDNSTEAINNIALKFVFRVKFKSSESVEYKRSQIIEATSNYVNNLGENDLSIDGLFEKIKEAVPDIQYINLIQLNNYYNGEVQTIINNPDVKSELLTVSQTTSTDSDGNITFVPDITVNVVNAE